MARFCRLLLFLLLPLSAVSQQNPPSPELQPRPAEPAKVPASGTDREIMLDVQVTDKSGAPVRGLQKEDFTILDDKLPLNVVSFRAVDRASADPPVEIILVVDAVNTSFRYVSYERTELKKFLLQNGGKLAQPTSLIFFTDREAKMQRAASRDGNALAALYDEYETGVRSITRSQGFYGAAERFEMSLHTLSSMMEYEKTRPGRKLLVWFSPGWPLLTGPFIQLSKKDEERLFQSIVGVSTGLREADITLYSIDPLGMADAGGLRISYYQEFLKGVPSANRTQAGDLGLQVLATQSGGRVLNSSNDLAQEIADCARDADAFYVLSFNSVRPDHANEYHEIEVRVDKPGAKVRTRTGYYAQP